MRSHVARMDSFNPGASFLVLFNNPTLALSNRLATARDIMQTLTITNNAPDSVVIVAKDYVTYEIYLANTFYGDCRES